jgi:hypothetical protein
MTPCYGRAKVTEGRRIQLPAHISARLPQLSGNEVAAWLFVVKFGRYRLLFPDQVEASETFAAILERGKGSDAVDHRTPFEAVPSALVALGARLQPVTLCFKGPPGAGWRLVVPRELPGRAMQVGESVYLFLSDGYLEVWQEEEAAEAMARPLEEVMP